MGLPNILTALRLLIGPIFLFIYSKGDWLGLNAHMLPWALLTVLLFSELSDALDGYLARRTNQVSDFGKIFDPMTDCITRICFFLTFTTGIVKLPVIFIMLIIYREIMVTALRSICALQGVALAARPSGKIKAIIQGVATFLITATMLPFAYGWINQTTLRNFAWWVTAGTTLYTVASGFEYLIANKQTLLRAIYKRGKNARV